MQVIARSNDAVRLNFLQVLLADAGIETRLLDAHASAIEGSIGAIPRRLMVGDADHWRARALIAEAGDET